MLVVCAFCTRYYTRITSWIFDEMHFKCHVFCPFLTTSQNNSNNNNRCFDYCVHPSYSTQVLSLFLSKNQPHHTPWADAMRMTKRHIHKLIDRMCHLIIFDVYKIWYWCWIHKALPHTDEHLHLLRVHVHELDHNLCASRRLSTTYLHAVVPSKYTHKHILYYVFWWFDLICFALLWFCSSNV